MTLTIISGISGTAAIIIGVIVIGIIYYNFLRNEE